MHIGQGNGTPAPIPASRRGRGDREKRRGCMGNKEIKMMTQQQAVGRWSEEISKET